MNQILYIKEINSKKSYKKRIHFLKSQLYISLLFLFLTTLTYFLYFNAINRKEQYSKQITDNYNILKLYDTTNTIERYYNKNGVIFKIIGIIEIPTLNVYYPIISESSDELLKIAPCRISGPMPGDFGNLCIAGHNYDNQKFFSQISTLKNNDLIIIYTNSGTQINYYVKSSFEVSFEDSSSINRSDYSKKELTLITCNNFVTSKRIIVKAFA